MHHLTTANIIFVFFVGALIIIEAFFSGIKSTSLAQLRQWNRNDFWDFFSIASLMSGFDDIIEKILWFGLLGALHAWNKEAGLISFGATSFWIQFAVVLLCLDFANYVIHRICHNSNWLWTTHKFHHSTERVTIFVSWRSHPLRTFTRPKYLVLILFGPTEALVAASLARYFFAVTNHMRWDSDWGWLGRYIFVSPRAHHIHHEKTHVRSNYGEIFIFWDVLLGTYQASDKKFQDFKYGDSGIELKDKSFAHEYLAPFWEFYTYPLSRLKSLRHPERSEGSSSAAVDGEDLSLRSR